MKRVGLLLSLLPLLGCQPETGGGGGDGGSGGATITVTAVPIPECQSVDDCPEVAACRERFCLDHECVSWVSEDNVTCPGGICTAGKCGPP